MKNHMIKFSILVSVLVLSACKSEKLNTKESDSAAKEIFYLGQKLPGLKPEIFAPGVVSINGRFESTISFSPDLKELYFDAKYENEASQIYLSKLINGVWTTIKKANLTKGNKREEMHPFVSPDGKRVYFTAYDSIFSDERIWYVNRLENEWSEAIKLDSPVNEDMAFFPNHSKNGGLYYFNLSKLKTYYAPNKDGEFIEPQEVEIDMGHHAFISPNGDYLLVTARNKEENRKDNDIYVYFKHQDGTWSNPINLGATVNSKFSEKTPSISPDGKYLFFGRDERDIEPGLSNIYWVSTEVIERLRLKE
ncbi:MAG: PD40 domain-containing protein [Saprospiraceae bacterium]|nr:PD40 domain-containing protein [Saprospiraceae bacterium]